MGKNTEIAWTDHTFNPWWGCVKVSPGCDHCYAETFAKRTGHGVWGADAPRRFFADKHFAEPLRWHADAVARGVRERVFCASMADVFEGRDDQQPARLRLWGLIAATPSLDWLLLTKRPGAVMHLLEADCEELMGQHIRPDDPRFAALSMLDSWVGFSRPPANVWVGTTVEDQARADTRIRQLAEVPAVVRFLSMEPLLERVDVQVPGFAAVDWIIVGGESGHHSRRFELDWARGIRDVAERSGKAFFMKQLGAVAYDSSSLVLLGAKRVFAGPKGGDIVSWPADLCLQKLPTPRSA